jgi:hypothetical protein
MTELYAAWATAPARILRRGHFWIPGERVSLCNKTYQRRPMFVEWEAPEQVTRRWPVVLMHGRGFQGTVVSPCAPSSTTTMPVRGRRRSRGEETKKIDKH